MRVTTEQLGSLRTADPVLYGFVLPAAKGVDGTTVEIDVSKIDRLHAKLLEVWAKENNIQQEPPQHDPKCQGECGRDECFRKHTAEINAKENERLALVAQQKAAEARIMEYVAAGLENTEENRQIFMKTWESHPKLSAIEIPTAQLVDAVIAFVRDKLTWRKTTKVELPASPLQPVQSALILSDGSEQLPLDTVVSTKHTIVQLKDLDARRRARDAGESELAPLENGQPRLPLGTKITPKHSKEQVHDLTQRTARAWARQQGSVGGSFFGADSQVI